MPNALPPSSSPMALPAANSNGNPLEQLADIHLPDPVSIWPLALGWWLLLALIFIALTIALLLRVRHQRNAYRRLALAELEQSYARLTRHQSTSQYLQELNALLKRVALSRYGKGFNPSLKGQAWLQWLDASCSQLPGSFTQLGGQLLVEGLYQKNPQGDIAALHQLALAWVRKHPAHLPRIKPQAPAPELKAESDRGEVTGV